MVDAPDRPVRRMRWGKGEPGDYTVHAPKRSVAVCCEPQSSAFFVELSVKVPGTLRE